ncbi:MAG: arsenic resistance N-acetyltransferase ArsN2 [Pseudomonadota bacterium]
MDTPVERHLVQITALLESSGLPTDDLQTLDLSLFRVVVSEGQLEAVGGLERLGCLALLRSLATVEGARSRGLGRQLVKELLALAQAEGVEEVYLLTESAEQYFSSLGFREIDRAFVPQGIKESEQFSSLCPGTATVMMKQLPTVTRIE